MEITKHRSIIEAAIVGFEAQKKGIDDQIAELRQMLNGTPAEYAAEPAGKPRKKRRISAAGRKAIAEAQRKRWAASRGQAATAAKKATRPKRKLSKAGRAAIVAALKKRWAAKKTQTATS